MIRAMWLQEQLYACMSSTSRKQGWQPVHMWQHTHSEELQRDPSAPAVLSYCQLGNMYSQPIGGQYDIACNLHAQQASSQDAREGSGS